MSRIERALRVLGVEPDASMDEITRAYKDLVRVWHPDRLGSDPDLQARAQEKLKEITSAYELLKTEAASGHRRGGPARASGDGAAASGSPARAAPGATRRKPGFVDSIPPWVLVVFAIGLVVALRSGRLLPGLGILVVYLVVHGLRRLLSQDA